MSSVSSTPPPPPPSPALVTTTTTSVNTGSSSGNHSDIGSAASLSPRESSVGDLYASVSDSDQYASISDSDPTASSDDAILIDLNDNEPRSEANHNHWHPQPEEPDASTSTSGSATTTTTTTTTSTSSTTTSSRTAKMSGILITTSVGVILACYSIYQQENASSKASLYDHYSWLIHVEAAIQCLAILVMMAGMSLPAAAYISPLWLQKFGHVLCLAGVVLLPAPLLHLPVIWCWIPSLLLVVVLCPAMLFVC